MAAANYRLCDKCGAKTFYDSDVDYEDSNLGAMAALCKDCAQTHEITIAKRGEVAELRAAIKEWHAAVEAERSAWDSACAAYTDKTLWDKHQEAKRLAIAAEVRLHTLAASEGQA